MQKHSVAEGLYLSFFSRPFYQDVGRRWKGFCLLYLLAVIAVCTIPSALRMQSDLRDLMSEEAPPYIRQLPRITIAKGVLSTDVPMPYRIVNPKTGEPVLIIDTSGQTVSLEGSKAFALATKSSLIVRLSPRQVHTYTFSDLSSETLTIDHVNAYDIIDVFIGMYPFIVYPFLLALSYLVWVAEALVLSVPARVYAKRLSLQLDFRAVVRICVVSTTPALIVGAGLLIAGVSLPYWSLLSMIGAMGFAVFGIQANIHFVPTENTDEKDPDR